MKVTIAVACDSAVQYGGSLCILGTFNTLVGPLPLVKAQCSLAVQVQWDKGDEGVHTIRALFMNEDGNPTLKDLSTTISVSIPEDRFYEITNCIINLQQLKFTKAGIYMIAISVDGRNETEIHMQVVNSALS